jgi:hypothetical protein
MLKLSTTGWISAFNAQGSRGFIVAVQVGAVKIYVAAVEALRKKECTSLEAFFWVSPPCMTKLKVLVLCFPDFTDISNMYLKCTNQPTNQS